MAVTPENRAAIINYYRKTEPVLGRVDLGTVQTDQGEELKVVFGSFPYQKRAIDIPGQPFTDRTTTQPVVALILREGVRPLAYDADLDTLPGSLVEKIASLTVPPVQQPRP